MNDGDTELDYARPHAFECLGVDSEDALHDIAIRVQSINADAHGGTFAPGDLARLQSFLPKKLSAAFSAQDEAGSVALLHSIALYVRDMARRMAGGGAWVLKEEKLLLYPDIEEASDQAWWLANQASVVAAGARAFHDQSSHGNPAGLARFCTGRAWAETELISGLYRTAISARCGPAAVRAGLWSASVNTCRCSGSSSADP